MKSISKSSIAIIIVVGLACAGVLSLAETATTADDATIAVVYPAADQRLGAIDSSFIFGHVPPALKKWRYELLINGLPTPVHEDGGFLAFVGLEPGEFDFVLDARLTGRKSDTYREYVRGCLKRDERPYPGTLRDTVRVYVPEPIAPYPLDSLALDPEFGRDAGDLVLSEGERLDVMLRGTPGCEAWFSIDGVIDSVPMVETEPRLQPYWGEAVFGAGAVPDSLYVRGVYTGYWYVSPEVRADTVRVTYHLAPPNAAETFARLFLDRPAKNVRDTLSLAAAMRLGCEEPRTASSSYRVSLNSPEYPFTVRFLDSVQIVRHGPRRGYLSIFQPEGVEALAVGAIGDWYVLRLSATQVGFVNMNSVERLPPGVLPPESLIRAIHTFDSEESIRIEFPLSGKHPFRVVEDNRRTLRIQLFGVTTDTDWIRYDPGDGLIDLATWSQPEAGLYEFQMGLTRDLWGYDAFYEGNTLVFQINKAPEDVQSLKGKTIVVDPGHSRDPGARGPTAYTEAEANLGIALELRKQLLKKGARVIMTRADNRHVPLYDRPALAVAHDADLYVSVHNNALPDGKNPFTNHGSSTYYYHPHSINLARAIQKRLVDEVKLPNRGVYHGNLAVNRPTQYPAVLVECAFMMIPEQEAALKTEKFRKKAAKGICKGIEDFLKGYNHGR